MNVRPASLMEFAADASQSALRISAIVLAAGLSSRMGDRPKMLLDTAGMPMIRRTLLNVLAFGPTETIVVTGHRAEDIEEAIDGLPVRCVRNPLYAEGQPTSVAAGVRALTAPCDAEMVLLGDQPLVTASHRRELAAVYGDMEDTSILVPHHEGKRGNPILFAARHIPAVMGGGINIGCRHLVETHGDDVCRAEFGSDVFTLDCDTPQDYHRLLDRLETAA